MNKISSDTNKIVLYEINKKSMLVAYIFWFFLGGLGIHRFYTGNKLSATIMLILWLISIPLLFLNGIVAFTMFIVYIWVFIDLFLNASNVKKRNTQIAIRLGVI